MKLTKVGALATAALFAITACSTTPGGGAGDKGTIEIWSSLPRQGSNKAQTDTVVNAIMLAIEEKGGKVGGYTIKYQDKDDSTAAKGAWDADTEIKNAQDAVAKDAVVAYIGTFNSGAAKLSIPILCKAGVVMISPANTYPGLTKAGKGEPNEPDVYYPDGCTRNYTRVVPADDLQGRAGALWASKLGVKKAYVLDDTELYGKGIADVFASEAPGFGIEVLGRDGIDGKATDYKALAEKIKAAAPELVYYGGITQNNAGQLWRDLRDALGTEVKLMGPDGIAESEFLKSAGAAGEGMYITFGGVPTTQYTGKAKDWLAAYEKKFGAKPEVYAIYGYEAAKVIIAAMQKAGAKIGDRETIRANVMGTKDFDNVLGKWSFSAEGDTSLTTMAGMQVKSGDFSFVKMLGGK